ncbi:MAG TPA: ATP-dependent DNA ligase, partial [Gaiella sp.]|nr:ATP-dependent DNA ligase [Gaiella sp.]
MRFAELARTSAAVAETSARSAKVAELADCLRRVDPEEIRLAVMVLTGSLPPLGVGWAALRELPPPAGTETLEVLDVAAALDGLGAASGPGSQEARRQDLRRLFEHATEPEQRLLRGVLQGGLRQGALEGVMLEAVARASDLPAADVRRATMLAGGLVEVARAALTEGAAGLAAFRLELFRPVQPMLAQTAADVAEALGRVGTAGLEWKLDGARLQVHREGDDVRAYTRSLAEVTDRVPEVVETVRRLPVASIVLDGEVIALRPDGRPHPFQVTMSRFGTTLEDDAARAVDLTPFFFDCLQLDGTDLLDLPLTERVARLADRVPDDLRPRRLETDDVEEAERFLAEALAAGHEGVMVKALDSPYEAGRRGVGWIKVKQARTLDLVVLAVEWGSGRRQGTLSNIHRGARDPATGGFVMLGKTFKGMTDAMLAWQTERFLELETSRDGRVVHVRPEQVVEIAFDGVQTSSRYPGGLALRFARVKGYRPDKRADEADTIDAVRAIHDGEPSDPGRAPAEE